MATSFMGKAKTALLGPRSRTISLCVLAATLMAVVSFLPFGQTLENRSLDLFYRLRPTAPQPLDLLIVAIDEPSFQELPYPWPWPRRLHGDLVRRLVAGGARLIVFDLVFAGATTPEEDNKLADALREAGNVVLGLSFEVARDPRFTRRILITPHKSFESAAKGQGLSLVVPDADGVVRHFHLGLGEQETLPLAALRLIRHKGLPAAKLTGLIDYAGPARSIDTVSYYQVVDPERPLPPSRIRGRIVLVGHVLEASATPQTQADAFYTPFFAKDGQRMSGVEIEGNILNTLLNGSWGRELPGGERLLLLVAVILAAGLVLARLKPVTGLIFLGASLAVLLGLSFGLLYLDALVVSPRPHVHGADAGICRQRPGPLFYRGPGEALAAPGLWPVRGALGGGGDYHPPRPPGAGGGRARDHGAFRRSGGLHPAFRGPCPPRP